MAGSSPAIRPTTIRIAEHVATRSNDSTRKMSVARVESSSSSARNGRGLNAHTSPSEIAMPTTPPMSDVATPSSRNCSITWRRFAPSALRMPISRVRSCTDTNMMFITPTPPMPSVSTPMKPSTSFSPSTIPPVIFDDSVDPKVRSARSSDGLKAYCLARYSRIDRSALGSSGSETACHTNVSTQGWYHSWSATV